MASVLLGARFEEGAGVTSATLGAAWEAGVGRASMLSVAAGAWAASDRRYRSAVFAAVARGTLPLFVWQRDETRAAIQHLPVSRPSRATPSFSIRFVYNALIERTVIDCKFQYLNVIYNTHSVFEHVDKLS